MHFSRLAFVSVEADGRPRQRPAAHKVAGYETDQKPCFFVYFFLLLDLSDKLSRRRHFASGGLRY